MPDGMSVLCLADYFGKPAEVVELTRERGKILIESWGEINTGDPEKLAEFLARALATYSIDTKIAIGFWSHGTGVFNVTFTMFSSKKTEYHYRLPDDTANKNSYTEEIECNDIISSMVDEEQSITAQPMRICTIKKCARSEAHMMLEVTGTLDILTNREATQMLELAFRRAGFFDRKVSMIFSDTCLNGMVELLHEFSKHADVIVASEDLEPGDGWNYKLWFEKMTAEPPVDSASWARQAVVAFEEAYRDKTDFRPCTLGAFATDNRLALAFKELIEIVGTHDKAGWRWMRDARERTLRFDVLATYDLSEFTKNLLDLLHKS